ncbi:putative Ig domain-containing protein, partial [Pedobacter panaciterrae]|uniref:Ig-like domain-containing protein n=1 Tax=Pedobacter panaciterrae TaxID=363849 RepID=UPI003F68FC10
MSKIVPSKLDNLNPSPMKWTSTLPGNLKKSILVLISIIAITLLNTKSYAQAKQRVYASADRTGTLGLCLICGVDNRGNAIDATGDFLNTASTISVGVGVAGQQYQELIFPNGNLPTATTGSVVKVSTGGLLSVSALGAITVQAFDGTTAVGNPVDAGSSLLNLLASGNQAEIFVPAPGVAYDRVRVKVNGGLLAVAANINVYHAYFLKDAINGACDAPVEELHGIVGNIAALGAVVDPKNAIDGSEATKSVLNASVGVAGYAQQTIVFLGNSVIGDSVRMVVSTPAALIEAQLLNSISIQTFNGNVPGAVVAGSGGLLNLRLLSGGGNTAVITFAPTTQFDRVQLRLGGVLSVLASINLHEVSRVMPTTTEINGVVSKSAVVCINDPVVLKINGPQAGATYTWYTQASGGTGTAGTTFTPTNLNTGINKFYVEAKRTDCTNTSPRTEVSITVNDPIPPVVTAPLPICNGSTVTLQVDSPVPGQTYKWYDVSTGGTALATSTTFNSPALTANKIYYVESVIGACVSPRVAVNVSVSPVVALAVITTNNEVISAGQTATLQATADPGNTIKWYAAASGGASLATGPSFTTPALAATTTYYVETESASGCVSSSRVAVKVTVTPISTGLPCNAATAQQSGIDGICLLCGVDNPEASTDANTTNFTSLHLAVGVGATGYQRLIFANPGIATDSIRIDIENPNGLLDLSLLGGITAKVMNGTTDVISYPLNSSLLTLRLLSGNRAKVTIPASAVYDRVEIRFGALVSALSSLNIYGAEVIYPNPTVTSGDQSICSGSTAVLKATANGGTTLRWFATASSTTVLATGETFTTPALTATTTYYIEVSKAGCANVERVPVKVTVNPAIVFATTVLSNATVNSSYSKQINVATGGTPAFTYTLAAGSSLPAGLTLSANGTIGGTPTASGDFTFSVVATDSKLCTATAAYTLKVTAALALPAATLPNGIVGTVYPTQTIPAATGGTTPYTYTATNLPPGLTFNPSTREITGTPTQKGTFVIPVTATDANGNSVSNDYTIIVRDPLVLPAATLADGTVGVPYPAQTIPAATGGAGPYTYSATGIPAGLSFDPLTRTITGTPTTKGTFTIPVKVTDADGNSVTRNYTIKVSDPLVLPAKVLADGTAGTLYATETLPSATGGTGPYTYVATNLPAGLSFNATTRQISGTPTQSGSYNINVEVTDAVGAKATQTYALKVNGVLSLPTAVLPAGLVGTVYPAQTLPAVTGGTSPYTYAATGVPAGLSFDPLTRKLTGTPATGGNYTIKVTATDANNLSTSTDYALVVNVGAPVVAGATTCSGTTATLTVSNTLPGVTYRWYASTGNTSIANGSSFTTPVLTATTTYYVEAVSGTAVSSRTSVVVTINAAPALAAIVTNNETISSGQTATLQATADAGNTIKWYAAASGGASLATGPSFTTPALAATTTYYVETESASGCVSSSRVAVKVTVTSGPVNPNCNAATAQQSGIDGLCLLCGVDNPGASTDANATNFTSIHLAVGVGATGYQRLIFASAGSATDSIRLDLETPTGLADVSVLGGATVTVLNGTSVVNSYPLNSSLLKLKLLSGNRFKATVPAGGIYDRVEIRFGALVSALDNLNIYGAEVIYPNPTVTSGDQSICSGSTAVLKATANGGTTLRWFATASSTTVLATGETFTTPALTATTTYYIEVSKAGCANVERVPVKVTVTSTPTAPTVAAAGPVCSGSSATLSVSSPVVGITYTWYSVATGGTVLFTGNSFTTPVLSANTTYYVQASAGTCTSATRTAVAVTVNPLPAQATVSTNNVSISSGQTATLLATASAGATINWYAAPTGGATLATGGSFTTPALTATTTYYVETVNASGCVSSARVPVTVTVVGGPVNPNCNAANSQQSGIEGICLLCAIVDPGNSVDNNFTNYTSIALPVGVAGSGYQRLLFPSSGAATDSIRLDLETPTGLADVTVLGGIQVRIMNGTSVVKTYDLNASLLYLKLLSGNRFSATLPATGIYDRVEVRAGGLVSALVNLRIYGAEVIYPNPTVSATGQTICSGSATVLSAAANGGTTLRWYTDATGGTLVHTGENFTTPVLTVNTTYYIEVSKGSCANKTRIPVTVTVTTAPAKPVVAAVAPVCSGSSAVIPVTSPVTGTTYKWYTVATGGTAIFTGAVFTTPALTVNTTYYVEAANGTCVSATRTAVAVSVNPLPVLPQIQASATTINPGQTAILTATSADANVIFKWYTSATSTTAIATGPTYVTPPLTATTTYYLEATSSTTGCSAPSRVQVTINVNGGGSPNPVPCEAPTLEEHGVRGVALLSGVFNPELAIDNNTKTGSSLVLAIGALNASVYQRLGYSSLSNIGDTVRVLLSAPGKLLSLGILSSIRVGTYENNTNNNDGLAINDPLVRVELLSGNTEALVSFVPTKRFNKIEVSVNSGLAGVLTTVDVNYAQRVPVAPEVTVPNVTACASQTATLTVLNPKAGITYKWYNAAGVFQANGTSFTTPALTANTRYFVEANTASGCTSYRTAVNITVTPTPQTPVLVSNDINTCLGNDVTLAVSNPLTGITYKWYNSTGVYQAGKDGVTFTVTGVNAATSYSVSAVNSCLVESAKATANIKVGTLDKPVITPASVTVRSGARAILTATSSTAGALFKWYDSPTSTTVLATTAEYTTDPLINTGTVDITRTFYVTAELASGCPASARASVVVTVTPNASPTDIPCEAATVDLGYGVDGLGILTGVFNPEKAIDDDAESASSFVMPVGALGASVYQKVGFTSLSNVGDTLRVRVSSPGKLLSLSILSSVELTTLKAGVSNNDMIVVSNPIVHLELLSGDRGAILSFVPQKQFDGVELRIRSGVASVLNTLDFNYAQRAIVAPTVQSATVSACAGTSATLSVQNPIAGIVYRWYKGTEYLTGKDGASLTTDPTLAAGTYDYFVLALRNGCQSAKTKVTVTILASPNAPVAATGNPATTCPNTPVALKVNPVTGVTFNWYDALTGGNLLASNTDTYTTPAGLSVGKHDFYVEAVNGNSCVNTTPRTKITLEVNPTALPTDITVAGANVPFCAGTEATLTATSTTVTSPIFTWYKDAALTDVAFTGATFKTPVLTVTTTYYVTVRGANKCENTAAAAKTVTLTVNPPATAADLAVSGADAPFCAGTIATLTATTTTVTNPVFTWYSDAALTNQLFEGPVYKTPALTASTTLYVTVKGSNKCENLSSGAEIVTITVNPPATAADIAVSGAGTPFCAGAIANLVASSTTVTNPVFTWYKDAALTDVAFTGATFKTPALTATTTYYVTVKGGNKCENAAATAKAVTLTVNPPALAADISVAGADAPFCAGNTAKLTASSTTVANPVFTWYSDAALTNAVFTGAIFNTPALTATKTYYVTVKGSNKCENTAATAKAITLTVNPPALATDINVSGADKPFCAGTTARLTASSTTVTNPVFTWYSDAALTDVVFTGAIFNTPALTATKTYYVTVRGSNKCENAAANAKVVTLTVNPPAIASDITVAGAGAPICLGTTAKLTASSTTVTDPVFTWYTDAALTNAVFTGAEFTTPVLTATTTYYVTVRGSNKCENTASTARVVTLTVNPPAVASDISVGGADDPICAGTTAKLTATTTTVTNPVFTWYSDAALTNAVFTGAAFTTPVLTATTSYYVTVRGSNKCENTSSSAKVVTITVNPPATAADINVAGADSPFCAGTSAKLTASSVTVTNPVFTWYSDAALTNAVFTGAEFNTPLLTATKTYYVTVSGDNRCENTAATAKTVTVTVNPPATAADIAVAGAGSPFCAGATAKLTASSTTVTNPIFTWYKDAALTDVAFTGAEFTTPVLTATTTYYVTVRGSNKCENAAANAKVVTLTVNPPAIASDI